MKLLTKTSLIFITISLFVFFISGILLYVILKQTTDQNINEELQIQFEHISRNLDQILNEQDKLIIPYNTKIEKVHPDTVHISNEISLKDTILAGPATDSYQVYRQITGYLQSNGNIYRITSFKSLIQAEELIEQLIVALTSMAVLLILGVFFVIRTISERIWSDFFHSLEKIKKFDLSKDMKVELPPSDISEFNELNNVLNIMIGRICSDFENLKEFTENITHEMQTPLAIIKSKAELFLQSKELSEEQALILSQITSNVTRLTKLNKGLVLLSRIENNQFTETNNINMTALLRESLSNLDYLSDSKRLNVHINTSDSIHVSINKTLAEVLITNLIKNAFVHSPEEGTVVVESEENSILVKNSGKNELSDLKIFDRFVKSNFKTNSLGIGLSLVRNICSQYGFQIKYAFIDKFHVFTVVFNN
jgi:signal transduction histidine kinase